MISFAQGVLAPVGYSHPGWHMRTSRVSTRAGPRGLGGCGPLPADQWRLTCNAEDIPNQVRRKSNPHRKENHERKHRYRAIRDPRTEHNPFSVRRHSYGPGVAPLEALAWIRVAARGFRQVG